MIIRDAQKEELQKNAEDDFEIDIVNFLQADYPDIVADLEPGLLRLMVRVGIARARSYDLTWRYSISMFVSLMFMFAPNFDEHPVINERLTNPIAERNELIDSVADSTTSKEWEETRIVYDGAAWGEAAELLPESWRAKWTGA